jgi:hypothetical protein
VNHVVLGFISVYMDKHLVTNAKMVQLQTILVQSMLATVPLHVILGISMLMLPHAIFVPLDDTLTLVML